MEAYRLWKQGQKHRRPIGKIRVTTAQLELKLVNTALDNKDKKKKGLITLTTKGQLKKT